MATTKWGRRRLNRVIWHRNPEGVYYVFGWVGSGRNQVAVTLAHRETRSAILVVYRKYQGHVDKLMNDVPRGL